MRIVLFRQAARAGFLLWPIVLTIGVFLIVFISGNRSDKSTATAKETPTAQHESKKETTLIGSVSAAAEFREMHNRALSPEAREDNRRKLWEKNFPWKPTYDPAVKATQNMISVNDDMQRVWNRFYLEIFFESEVRFSPQFEQIYRIMEKYDRTDNSSALGWLFENLRCYHQLRMQLPDKIMMTGNEFNSATPLIRRETSKPWTYGEINGESLRPHKEVMPDEPTESIIEELVQIPSMAEIEGSLVSNSKAHLSDFWDIEVGDPLLAPFVGYQAGYDKWNDERNRMLNVGFAKQRSKNRPAGILSDGTLVNAKGQPIVAGEGSLGGFVNSVGQEVALQEMEDGSMCLY